MAEAGTLCTKQEEKTFQWQIKDFLELEDNSGLGYKSPKFCFAGVSWEIWISPYGSEVNQSVGYVDLLIRPISSYEQSAVGIIMSFKTADEKDDLIRIGRLNMNSNSISLFHFTKVISRSDLIKRKSKLLPSGILTVICKLDTSYTNGIDYMLLDAAVQTEKTGECALQQHLHEISLNGENSDIVLKVEDQEFKLHKCILAARSPVFSAMMRNDMKESVTGIVNIEDIDPKTFSEFLYYLYTGSTEVLTPVNVTKLFTAANKYQVEVLKENCLDYMLANISIDNFCDIFVISVQHNEEKLKETCIRYFGKHLLDIIKSCKYQSLLCENPITCNELLIKHVELNKNI